MNDYMMNISSVLQSEGGISNSDLSEIQNIKATSKDKKEQLKKVATEFESVFVAKMLNEMEKTVDREGSLFQESKYLENLKSFMYNDIAREISKNPKTSIGFAAQMYKQLEKTL